MFVVDCSIFNLGEQTIQNRHKFKINFRCVLYFESTRNESVKVLFYDSDGAFHFGCQKISNVKKSVMNSSGEEERTTERTTIN